MYTPYVCTPLYIHPQGCTHPHMPAILCAAMFSEALHVVGGCKGLPFVLGYFPYTTPIWGCLPFICTPHTQLLVSCASVCFGDISLSCGYFSLLLGFGGVPPSVGGFGVISSEACLYGHINWSLAQAHSVALS